MVELVAVTRSYRLTPWSPGRPALECFSLRIAAGQMVAILGANGSGKSTALRIAAGLLRPTAGVCRLWGSERPDLTMNRKIGYVPDVCALPGFLTVGEVLSVAARLGGLGRVAELDVAPDALTRVGLEGKAGHPVAGLSRGQAQRLGLAVALLRAPELLILDEPLSPLDDGGAARMVALLAELRADGCTVLLTAHRSPELTPHCDRMVWLADGRQVEERAQERGMNVAPGGVEAGRSPGRRSRGWGEIACLVRLRLRAAVRERLYLVALAAAGGVVSVAHGLRGWVAEADRWALTLDLGMAALSVAGGALALIVTVNAWFTDVINGWGRGVLATVVGRRRWLVVHALAAAFLALGLCVVLALAVMLASEDGELTRGRVLRGSIALGWWWLKLTAMAGIALGIAALSRTPSTAMVGAASVLLLGHLHPLMDLLADGGGWSALGWNAGAMLLPDFSALEVSAEWIAEGVSAGPRLRLGEIGVLAGWAAVVYWRVSRRG